MNMATQIPHIPALKEVGLVYVSDQEPGISRERRGRNFCYRLPGGKLLDDPDVKARIKALGLPPAYNDVWICLQPNGHLQATGRDARGRKQYRYHNDWQVLRDEKKYDELRSFGAALPAIRRRVTADLDGSHDERATLAALVHLLDVAHLRVGNEAYRKSNGTYGATTLLKRHIAFGPDLELRFTAKGGRKVRRRLRAPRLQKMLERIAGLPGKQLFVWQDDDGNLRPVDAGHLNRYLAVIGGDGFSAKTFRTWGGTVTAFAHAVDCARRDETPTIKCMAEAASEELCNTATVCRNSYVHPAVLSLSSDEASFKRLRAQLEAGLTPVKGLLANEQRLLEFLDRS